MIPAQLWVQLPKSARRVLHWTHGKAHARGLCSRCYSAAARTDAVIDYNPIRLTTEDVVDELQHMDARGEGLTQQQMADRLKIHRATLQRHLAKARQRGLIT